MTFRNFALTLATGVNRVHTFVDNTFDEANRIDDFGSAGG